MTVNARSVVDVKRSAFHWYNETTNELLCIFCQHVPIDSAERLAPWSPAWKKEERLLTRKLYLIVIDARGLNHDDAFIV